MTSPVVVAASAAHRGQAFEAARRLIDDLKAQVPVWKRQVFDDGERGVGRNALTGRSPPYARRVLPDWLLWLLPVPLATLRRSAWAGWSSRARGPQDAAASVQEYARFRAALGGVGAAAGAQPGRRYRCS